MYLMAIAWLFAVPAYYLAKSKGRSGFGYAILTMALANPIPFIGYVAFGFILAALPLVLLYFLPAQPGALGEKYLKIIFPCPECGQTVSFPRHREGLAVSCPHCGEMIRVPEDEHSPPPAVHNRTKPATTQGEVCFESFGQLEPAHVLVAILSDNGIKARVVSDSGGGVLPQIGNTEGHKVMIDAGQWDEAVIVEKQCQQPTDDAVKGAL